MTVLVKRIIVTVDTTGIVSLRSYNTALASAVGAGLNLNMGGAVGKGLIKNGIPAAEDGTVILPFKVIANTPFILADKYLAALAAGKGILIATATVNVNLYVSYEWNEF